MLHLQLVCVSKVTECQSRHCWKFCLRFCWGLVGAFMVCHLVGNAALCVYALLLGSVVHVASWQWVLVQKHAGKNAVTQLAAHSVVN